MIKYFALLIPRCGSGGRVLPWGGRGRGFKSRHLEIMQNKLLEWLNFVVEPFLCILENYVNIKYYH